MIAQTLLNFTLYVITCLVIPDMLTRTLICPGPLYTPIIHAMDFYSGFIPRVNVSFRTLKLY